MSLDPYTYHLFQESNFDAYDSGRYSPILRDGLREHGIDVHDVLAVTHDFGLWAICKPGVFNVSRRGVFKKRIEIGPLLRYSDITSITEEPSATKTVRVVLTTVDRRIQINFGAGGMENTPEIAAGHRRLILERIHQAMASAR